MLEIGRRTPKPKPEITHQPNQPFTGEYRPRTVHTHRRIKPHSEKNQALLSKPDATAQYTENAPLTHERRAIANRKNRTENVLDRDNGGWDEIRTHETLSRLYPFQGYAFNHSATHPHARTNYSGGLALLISRSRLSRSGGRPPILIKPKALITLWFIFSTVNSVLF